MQHHVIKKITAVYGEYVRLQGYPEKKKTPKWQENTLEPFLVEIKGVLYIFCRDQKRLKRLENFYGVKMTEEEHAFVNDQLGPRLMLCTTEVCRSGKPQLFVFCTTWVFVPTRGGWGSSRLGQSPKFCKKRKNCGSPPYHKMQYLDNTSSPFDIIQGLVKDSREEKQT